MALQGAELEIILPKGQPYEQGIDNWHIHDAPFGRGYRWYISNLVFPPLIKEVYQQTQFHILRAHSLRFIGPAALWAKKRYKLSTPVVAHHHHLDDDPLNLFIERPVLSACSLVITDSHFSKRQIAEVFRIDTSHVEVIYNGVDERFRPEIKSERLIKEWDLMGKKTILTLGGLKARKNLAGLLEIFRRVVRQVGDRVVLIIAGSGPELSRLQKYAARLSLENQVRFTGFIAEVDKAAVYNMADVYVSSSSMEGFGMTPAEAMACGKSAVVSDSGSLSEVVLDEKTGFVVSLEEPELFAERIVTLLKNPTLADEYGRAGLAHVKQNFRWDLTAAKALDLYQQLLDDRYIRED